MVYFGLIKILEVLQDHFYWTKIKCNAKRVRDRCVMYRQSKSKIFPYEFYNYLLVPKKYWVGISMYCFRFI
jgi:hypothetical protein